MISVSIDINSPYNNEDRKANKRFTKEEVDELRMIVIDWVSERGSDVPLRIEVKETL